jgi:hypothetical protein
MRNVAITATVLSVALVGSASAQQLIPTDPITGAVTGANAAAAQGAAAAGPLGALVAAPLGFGTGVLAGTVGMIGTVARAATTTPSYYPAAPAGYPSVPVSYPDQQAYHRASAGYPAPTVAYAQPISAGVIHAQPAATRVVYVTRAGYADPRRTFVRQVADRPASAYRRAAFRNRAPVGYRQVGFRSGPVQGRMATMNRARVY